MTTTHRFICSDSARLQEIAPDSVQLIVTSPPYPMISMWDEQFAELNPEIGAALENNEAEMAWRGMHALLRESWRECARVLAPGGFAVINIGDAVRTIDGRFTLFANHARILDALAKEGLTPLPLVLWRKPTNAPTKFMGSGMLPGGAYVTLEHEYIIIARKGGPRRPGNETERARRRRSAIFWEERNKWFSDLWELRGTGQRSSGYGRTRTAAYPLEIPFRLAAMYSWEGDTILDPFSGTGTTALAAAALGRNSLSLEITEGAHAGAVRRFEDSEAIAGLVGRQRERLARHRRFASERASVLHHNDSLATPVVTGQEVDLRLLEVAGIERRESTAGETLFRAEHTEVSSAALDPGRDGEGEGLARRD